MLRMPLASLPWLPWTPLITIQILGVIYKIKEHRKAVEIPKMPVPASGVIPLDAFGDDDIIEL